MTKQVGATKTLFIDNFNTNGQIDSAKWNYNVYANGGSFYGNTQQRQELPKASDGALHLRLDTYNPTDPKGQTFLGSEAISKQLFSVGSGIAFEARARYVQDQKGIIGGFFTFAGPANSHDEIDFEALSNDNSKIQTNIYHAEPLGEGHPQSFPLSGTLMDYHTYRIEWLPNAVRWLVDGVLVRTETNRVPDKAMAMHLNIWGPPSSWGTGDASLKAVGSASQNQTFLFDIDSVKVEQLASSLGTSAADNLNGTGKNDWLDGGHGNDRLYGRNGHDTLLGGRGDDKLYGHNGDDKLAGGNNNDLLFGGRGDDKMYGHSGRDTLVGHSGNDALSGGSGADKLTGGLGADKLWGGSGADSFVFNSIKESTVDPVGRDTIVDFSRKGGDKIDLSGIDANLLQAKDQAFSFIGDSAFSQSAGELRYDTVAGQTYVYGDVDGDGVADFSVQLQGSHLLTQSYFTL